MEFPILNNLNLPETCIKLIKQFLWEPHPTAVLIKELTFETQLVLWEDPDVEDIRYHWVVFGPNLRGCTEDDWYEHHRIRRRTPPMFVTLDPDEFRCFPYDMSGGECSRTNTFAFIRHVNWWNELRDEQVCTLRKSLGLITRH